MITKLIGKLDRILFFGLIKFLYLKIKDLSVLNHLKNYKYFHQNYYNFKNTTLSELCDKYGTDKGFNKIENRIFYNNWHPHNYTDYYSSLFDHCRENIKKVFECGIGTNNPKIASSMGREYIPGGSLRVWREYFPNAQIYGADIDSNILFKEDRIKTYYVDQLNKNSIEKMWSEIGIIDFDLIIDDGLHTLEAGVTLFENSFKFLRKGGIYIIEDVDPSYLISLSNYLEKKVNLEIISLKAKNKKLLKDNNIIIIRN